MSILSFVFRFAYSFFFFRFRAMPLPAHFSQSPASSVPGQCHCPLISPNLLLLPFQGYAVARSFLPISFFFPSRAMTLPAHFSQSPSFSLPGQCHCPLISPNLLLLSVPGQCHCPLISPNLLLLPFQGNTIARSFLPISCFFSFQGYAIARSFLPISFFFRSMAIPLSAHFSQSPASFLPGQCHCPLISPNLLLLSFQGYGII